MKRVRDEGHLNRIRALPCVLTARPGVHAAHVRFGWEPAGKRPTGMGEKPDDRWAVPLCPELHTMHSGAQHNHNERLWWEYVGVDVIAFAAHLYEHTNDPWMLQELVAIYMPRRTEYLVRIADMMNGEKPNLKEQAND